MSQAYFEGGSPSNYTIGGSRFWFNRLMDETTDPMRYEGYRDMGNVVDCEEASETEVKDHFTAKSGTRKRDASLVMSVTEQFNLTLDELSCRNLRDFFMGGTITKVAASQNTAEVTDEVMCMDETELRLLGKGYNASTIVVKDITGVTTYVKDTDYTEVTHALSGYKGIRRIANGAIGDGDFVRVSYKYDVRAHRTFAPATKPVIKGKCVLFGVADVGNEFIREIAQVQLERNGGFKLNDQDWSNYQITVKILDDSESQPSFPDGIFRHYGVGTGL